MSFADIETSEDLGVPIELFRFRTGPGENDLICYTDAERPVVYDGQMYEVLPIDRDPIKVTGNLDRAAIEVRLPKDTDIGELYRVFPPSYVVTLVIFQGHEGQNDFLVSWSGRVKNCAFKSLTAHLTCESVVGALQRPGLRRNYQIACPHVLYGPHCRAAKNPRNLTIVAIPTANALTLTHPLPLGVADEKFITGTVEWLTADGRKDIRNITAISRSAANVIDVTASGSTLSAVEGATATLLLGCDHSMTTCKDVFDNIVNYGGQPWIPLKNPVGTGSPFI